MTIKVKKLERENTKENSGIVTVTLEKDGKEYIYMAKQEHVLDEDKFNNLLQTWDRMIREQEAQPKLKEEEIEKILKMRAKMEVKD
jgi:hypothetical protein